MTDGRLRIGISGWRYEPWRGAKWQLAHVCAGLAQRSLNGTAVVVHLAWHLRCIQPSMASANKDWVAEWVRTLKAPETVENGARA